MTVAVYMTNHTHYSEHIRAMTCDATKRGVLTATICDEGGACVETGRGAELLTGAAGACA
jgi:hypothetical protein